jgi:hypothetical protein
MSEEPQTIETSHELADVLREAAAAAADTGEPAITLEHVEKILIDRKMKQLEEQLGFSVAEMLSKPPFSDELDDDDDDDVDDGEEQEPESTCCGNDPCTEPHRAEKEKCPEQARQHNEAISHLFDLLAEIVKVEIPDKTEQTLTREEGMAYASKAYDRMFHEVLDEEDQDLYVDAMFADDSLASIHLRYPQKGGGFDPDGKREVIFDRATGDLSVVTDVGSFKINMQNPGNRCYLQWLIAALTEVDEKLELLDLADKLSKRAFMAKAEARWDELYEQSGDADDEDDRPQTPVPKINRAERSALVTCVRVENPNIIHHEILFTAARALERLGFLEPFDGDMPSPETIVVAAQNFEEKLLSDGRELESLPCVSSVRN